MILYNDNNTNRFSLAHVQTIRFSVCIPLIKRLLTNKFLWGAYFIQQKAHFRQIRANSEDTRPKLYRSIDFQMIF